MLSKLKFYSIVYLGKLLRIAFYNSNMQLFNFVHRLEQRFPNSAFLKLLIAYMIMEFAHRNQFRRDGITPYKKHLIRVAMQSYMKYGWLETVAAFLHDFLEDNTIFSSIENSIKYLQKYNIPDEAIVAVELLTRDKNNPERSGDNYYTNIKNNDMARKIKLLDILDNLSDKPTEKQLVKYGHALNMLAKV
jgi:hypothetical protein